MDNNQNWGQPPRRSNQGLAYGQQGGNFGQPQANMGGPPLRQPYQPLNVTPQPAPQPQGNFQNPYAIMPAQRPMAPSPQNFYNGGQGGNFQPQQQMFQLPGGQNFQGGNGAAYRPPTNPGVIGMGQAPVGALPADAGAQADPRFAAQRYSPAGMGGNAASLVGRVTPGMARGGVIDGGVPGMEPQAAESSMRRYSPIGPKNPIARMTPSPEDMAHRLPQRMSLSPRINVKLPRPKMGAGRGAVKIG